MDINRTGPHATVLFFFTPILVNKMELFHTNYTTCIRGLILELSRSFKIEFGLRVDVICCGHSRSFSVVLDASFRNWPSKATKILNLPLIEHSIATF